MVDAIQFTSAAECIAHAVVMRAKFYGRKAPVKFEPKPEPPVVKIVTKEPVKHVKKPLWKTAPIMFNEHEVAYRVAMVKARLAVDICGDEEQDWHDKKTMMNVAIEILERHPGISLSQARGPRRNRPIVEARMEIAYEIYMQTDASLPAIGRFLGGRDHTTILHSVRTIAARRAQA